MEGQESPRSVEQNVLKSGLAVSFLVRQHKLEMLDHPYSLKTVLKETAKEDFLNMLQVCIFVPFLHNETPKP